MPVLGVRFRSIEARRFQEGNPPNKLRVDHNSSFQSVTEENPDRLRIDFTFTTSYGGMGVIKIEGSLMHRGGDIADALARWKEERKLSSGLAQEVHNGILQACMPEAVMLARDLRLPPPLPFPQVRVQAKGDGNVTAAPGSKPSDFDDDLKPAP
jgi:hypothetical protein